MIMAPEKHQSATIGSDSNSALAHDLNNLLAILSEWIEIGLRDTTQPEVRAHLQGAVCAVACGKHFVKDLNTPRISACRRQSQA